MKSIIFFIISLFLLSCSQPREISKQVFVSGYNFTAFTSKGFLFSPEQYLGDYESIGLIEVEIYPGVEKTNSKSDEEENRMDTWSRDSEFEYGWRYTDNITPDEVLDSLYSITSLMGADAVVRLDITRVSIVQNKITLPGIKVSGFAIKRK